MSVLINLVISLFVSQDNFMNWNTSSSFENLAPPTLPVTSRSRTPANRRSAVVNKTEDDVVFRICRLDYYLLWIDEWVAM